MNEPERMSARLGLLTAWVTAGLCFIVVFSISITIALFFIGIRSAHNAQAISDLTDENRTALCGIKSDTRNRIATWTSYLKTLPPDDPTRQFVQQFLIGQNDALVGLAAIDCRGLSK